MAHTITSPPLLLLLLISIAAAAAAAENLPASVNLQELETMKYTLNSRGYTLFSNAISTSDLQLQISSPSPSPSFPTISNTDINISSPPFYTIFAAKNFYMYALDMASDASAYVSTLRYHVIPNRRLTNSDLMNLTSPFLETLLPHFSILVSKRQQNATVLGNNNSSLVDNVVLVDGVRVSDPDIFVGSRIVVHGLDEILVTGIVKTEDLFDDEKRLGLISTASGVIPSFEENVQVVAPRVIPSIQENVQVVAPVSEADGRGRKHHHVSHNHHHHRHVHHHRRSRGHRRHGSHDRKEDL